MNIIITDEKDNIQDTQKISLIGEGIVWVATIGDDHMRFKVKGEKHGNKGKKSNREKKVATIAPEVMASMKDFVEYAVTEGRLNQGLQEVFGINGTLERKKIGEFLKWINKDILKEESDTLVANNLEFKQVSGMISNKAKTWFFAKEAQF